VKFDITNVEFYLKIYIELDFEYIKFCTELDFIKIKFQNTGILLNGLTIGTFYYMVFKLWVNTFSFFPVLSVLIG